MKFIQWPKSLRGRLRRWWAWRQQGKPIDLPTVLAVGTLTIKPDGVRVMSDWHFDGSHMNLDGVETYILDETEYERLWELCSRFVQPNWVTA